jgi:uncharacterized membrane protein
VLTVLIEIAIQRNDQYTFDKVNKSFSLVDVVVVVVLVNTTATVMTAAAINSVTTIASTINATFSFDDPFLYMEVDDKFKIT